MKQASILILFMVSIATAFGQNSLDQYAFYTEKADSLYRVKEYKSAALAYSDAFKSLGWKGSQVHRYSAARSWALAGVPDSAFFQLERIATMLNYANYGQITTDSALASLHQDKRWDPILTIIKSNKQKVDKAEATLNKPLIAQLDSIFKEDQKCRIQLDTIAKKYGWESAQTKAQMNLISKTDSINLIKVMAILDKYGWLGSDVISSNGNLTLFLIIQHSDLSTQKKYLPMMREAVKNGRAFSQNLALLEDRVALGQGKRQIYGTQISRDNETKDYYVLPLEDPDNVDKRRAGVGLQPLAEYLKEWQIKWDVEQYKRDLPRIESKIKARPK